MPDGTPVPLGFIIVLRERIVSIIMKFLKTIYVRIFRLLLVLMAVLSVASCRKEHNKFLIGVSQCSIDEWRDKQNREMESEVFYHGADIRILSVKDDSRRQAEYIRQLMNEGGGFTGYFP